MPIPKHHEFRIPILNLLKDGREMGTQEFVAPMVLKFNVSSEELNETYEKGKHNKFANRVFWALSYLNMSGLVSKPKRGVYKISKKGIEMLVNPQFINHYIKEELKKRREQTNDEDDVSDESVESIEDLTPEESLRNSFDQIKDQYMQK